jgi:hypothetical protein
MPPRPVVASLPGPDDHPAIRRPEQLASHLARLLLRRGHPFEHDGVPLAFGPSLQRHVVTTVTIASLLRGRGCAFQRAAPRQRA